MSNDFFFRCVDLLCLPQKFCEWSHCDFLQLILFANTAAFFYSLLGLVSHSFWGGDSGEEITRRWRCVEKINHSRDSWLVLRSLNVGFHVYSAILESFFYADSAIVDSFVIVSFFLKKHCILQYYRWLTCYICVTLCRCFGPSGCYFVRVPSTTPAHNVVCYSAVAHILNSLGKFDFRA